MDRNRYARWTVSERRRPLKTRRPSTRRIRGSRLSANGFDTLSCFTCQRSQSAIARYKEINGLSLRYRGKMASSSAVTGLKCRCSRRSSRGCGRGGSGVEQRVASGEANDIVPATNGASKDASGKQGYSYEHSRTAPGTMPRGTGNEIAPAGVTLVTRRGGRRWFSLP